MGDNSEQQPGDIPEQGFVLRDWVIFIPTLTTALALAWQVGALVPTGGFEFFSISDHLVAAAKALPVALAISSAVAMTYVTFAPSGGQLHLAPAFYVFGRAIGLYIAFPFMAVFYALTLYGIDVPFMFLMLTLILLVITAWLLSRRSVDKGMLLFFFFTGFTMLSTSLASDLTLFRLWRIDSGRIPLATITTKSGSSKGYVVMAGERGFLVYNSPRSTTFIRADEVVMVGYERKH